MANVTAEYESFREICERLGLYLPWPLPERLKSIFWRLKGKDRTDLKHALEILLLRLESLSKKLSEREYSEVTLEW